MSYGNCSQNTRRDNFMNNYESEDINTSVVPMIEKMSFDEEISDTVRKTQYSDKDYE